MTNCSTDVSEEEVDDERNDLNWFFDTPINEESDDNDVSLLVVDDTRLVVPPGARPAILKALHLPHAGFARTKATNSTGEILLASDGETHRGNG